MNCFQPYAGYGPGTAIRCAAAGASRAHAATAVLIVHAALALDDAAGAQAALDAVRGDHTLVVATAALVVALAAQLAIGRAALRVEAAADVVALGGAEVAHPAHTGTVCRGLRLGLVTVVGDALVVVVAGGSGRQRIRVIEVAAVCILQTHLSGRPAAAQVAAARKTGGVGHTCTRAAGLRRGAGLAHG